MDRTTLALPDLLSEVVLARGALRGQRRRSPVAKLDLGSAQCRLVDALRAYEEGLSAGGAPMPYRLRDELRLLEGLGQRGTTR